MNNYDETDDLRVGDESEGEITEPMGENPDGESDFDLDDNDDPDNRYH